MTAAALLLALKPTLQADQVLNIVERSATDVNRSNGCKQCPLQRDSFSGWGRLDVAKAIAALDGVLPSPDRFEPNDDAGTSAARLSGKVTFVKATLDFWDDQIDVYRLYLRKEQRLRLTLKGPERTVKPPAKPAQNAWATSASRSSAPQAIGAGASHKLGTAPASGWYYVKVKLATPGAGPYELTIAKSRNAARSLRAESSPRNVAKGRVPGSQPQRRAELRAFQIPVPLVRLGGIRE